MKRTFAAILTFMLLLPIWSCAEEARFTPGTYEGSAGGFHGKIHLQVEVTENEIKNITVGENEETYLVGDLAFPILSESIVKNQSLADIVTGATITSRGMINAVSSALEAAGATKETIDELKGIEIPVANPGDTETDVIVVGAGTAGMIAAMQAYDEGANVILLEKNDITGGSLRVSCGGFLAVGAEEYADLPTTADDIHRWYSIQAGPVYNDDVFYTVINNGGNMFRYFKDNGFVFTKTGQGQSKLAPNLYAISTTSTHFGAGIADTLEKAVTARNIDLRYNSPVVELVQAEDGSITGVVVENEGGRYTISAKKVILATGGFTHNKELMAQYGDSDYDQSMRIAASGGTGDGHIMGMNAGGHLIGEGILPIYVGGYDPSLYGNQPLVIPLFVDSKGYQMCAGDEHYTTITHKIVAQEDQTTYAIYGADSQYFAFDFKNGMKSGEKVIEDLVSMNRAYKADSIEELAALAGIDGERLLKTIEEHNWYCDLGIRDEWGTDISYMIPITKGPYYAVRQVPCVMGTIAGLEVTEKMEVVDSNGAAIPNLYAAGELIFGNMFNHTYPLSGTAIGLALSSGQLAAQNAAASLN